MQKKYSAKGFLLASLSLIFALSVGCFAQIDQALDCSNVCNRFEECFDSSFDTETCTDDCRDNADNDQDFADQVDACENCVDDRACTEDFSCIDECFGILP